MGAASIREDPNWSHAAIASRRAVGKSIHQAGVQERKLAHRARDLHKQRRQQRENQRLASGGASFSLETHERLKSAISTLAGGRRASNPEMWAALDILGQTLDTGEADPVVILPSAEDARALVAVLRSPGVGGLYGDAPRAIERLEEIGEVPAPAGSGFNVSAEAFRAALKLVERHGVRVPSRDPGSRCNAPKVTDATIYSILSEVKEPKRFEAAAILRRVVIRAGRTALHMTSEEAAVLSEVLTALGGDRFFLSSVNRIAALAPAAAA
ncbi:hypothetical protein [Methylobacterium sp. J-092]|uniref:hypothetical protein n=1 Tax=Methylobacterium sp. J-092 TaxID=2836667 RepID=UPI001FBBCAA4|nr:hypothetical protein [Methylobacterium sp. J-092]MCJ2009770.1 hypothetical protein [Methylobacterium sp. J-092]